MTQTIKNALVTAALILPLLFVFFLMTGEAAQAHHKNGHQGCRTWDVPETDRGWRISRLLIQSGGFGMPSDGAERLYSPQCQRKGRYARGL